eukprot:Gb_20528 [translate_table: standard]
MVSSKIGGSSKEFIGKGYWLDPILEETKQPRTVSLSQLQQNVLLLQEDCAILILGCIKASTHQLQQQQQHQPVAGCNILIIRIIDHPSIDLLLLIQSSLFQQCIALTAVSNLKSLYSDLYYMMCHEYEIFYFLHYNFEIHRGCIHCVGVHKDVELKAMKSRLNSFGLRTLDLTDNDLAKDHLRYLMGGRANVENEFLFRFVFPERPGALMKFLDTFSPRWNISLFHYRSQGEMGANVLVGMQIPTENMEEFTTQANTLGYEYEDVRENEAVMLLMH